MKRKISVAFCLACIWAICLLTTPSFTDAFANIPYAFSNFSLTGRISSICSALIQLVPFAIILLLVLNTKRNVEKIATITLAAFCILRIVTFIFGTKNLFSQLPKYDEIMTVTNSVCSLITSLSTIVLLYLSAKSIKDKKDNKYMKVFNIIIIVSTVFLALLVLLSRSHSSVAQRTSFISLLIPVITGFSLQFLPKTIYDYENCTFLNKKLSTTVLAMLFAILVIFSISKFVSSGNGGNDDYEIDNNTSKCFQCKGSGLINDGFIKFKTCPTCKGTGVIFR